MACEIKSLESEATTGFFVLLGEQRNKAVLSWVMKEELISSRYECPKCKKGMRLVERKGMIDVFEWRCRVQSKENPHFVCRSFACEVEVQFQDVWILTNSHVSVWHLSNWTSIGDQISLDILNLLDRISPNHSVHFQWVSFHVGIDGIEKADFLVRTGVEEGARSIGSFTFSELSSLKKT
ncbi:hypothetical protein TNCV_2601081 [Trichonephila clavipes]|nr:hypothetical protein TNCV_2601081 [Trichonephila clavipes]